MNQQPVATGGDKAPLEDLMVAMDVVDTIRHRHLIVERELDAAGRRERLIDRLRDIYAAQGIEVTDAALEAGVDALEKERFAYTPATGGISTALAKLYVRRARWSKPLLGLIAIAALLWAGWYYTVGLPQSRFQAALPGSLQAAYASIVAGSQSDAATTEAGTLLDEGERYLSDNNFAAAESVLRELESLRDDLALDYEIRIVSRPGEYSGIWRVPDVNPDAKNYYLIVEAVDATGNVLTLPVRNEEDGRRYRVQKWGLRVDEETFEAVAADKRDDGIVQDYVLGRKPAGRLEPEYVVPTSGATITDW